MALADACTAEEQGNQAVRSQTIPMPVTVRGVPAKPTAHTAAARVSDRGAMRGRKAIFCPAYVHLIPGVANTLDAQVVCPFINANGKLSSRLGYLLAVSKKVMGLSSQYIMVWES